MSESHKQNIPIITRHVDQIGYTFGMAEASLGKTGERVDYFAMARRPIVGAIPGHPDCRKDKGRKWVDLYFGSTSVHEFKCSIADLRRDSDKPWRKPGVPALGERRFYWLRVGGEVRPEHVEESNGWGVVWFNELRYEIVRPSMLFPVLKNDEHELIARIAESKARAWMEGQVFGGRSNPSTITDRPAVACQAAVEKRETLRAKGPVWLPGVIKYVRQGPATTSELCRLIRNECGIRITASKLADQLKQAGVFVQDGPGGNWSLKEKETAS